MEKDFHEFPCWEVTHFVWMISWGWEIHMGMVNTNLYQISCLKKAHRQPIVSSMDVLFSHDSYLGCSPKASLHMLEEPLGDTLMIQHLDIWRIISYEDATWEEREITQSILILA